MLLNEKGMINGGNNIGKWSNDTIGMTAVFSAVVIGQVFADSGITTFSKFLRRNTLQCCPWSRGQQWLGCVCNDEQISFIARSFIELQQRFVAERQVGSPRSANRNLHDDLIRPRSETRGVATTLHCGAPGWGDQYRKGWRQMEATFLKSLQKWSLSMYGIGPHNLHFPSFSKLQLQAYQPRLNHCLGRWEQCSGETLWCV